MDSPLQAPAVVAVVVTCDPGPWLEEVLHSLAEQDYPNLAVLVIDANSAEDPTSRVARVIPGAYVCRLPANRGYAASANEA
jgi:GT2 family glycosyltransferase